MPVRCKEDGEETFGPHLTDISGLIHNAVEDVYENYGRDFHELEAWTRAGIIRDKIVARLKRYCEEAPGLQPIRKGNSSYFGFHSKYLVKVKRFGAGFRMCLPSTTASTLFDSQECPPIDQGELINALDVTTVYVGYIPTENAPLTPPVFIVCKNEQRKVEWFIECGPPSPPAAEELIPRRGSDADGGSPVRVKVKPGRKSGTDG